LIWAPEIGLNFFTTRITPEHLFPLFFQLLEVETNPHICREPQNRILWRPHKRHRSSAFQESESVLLLEMEAKGWQKEQERNGKKLQHVTVNQKFNTEIS